VKYRPTAFELWAFAVGAISDVLLIRNGLAYAGPTLLDRYPVIWLPWIAVVFLCSFFLEFQVRRAREKHAGPTDGGGAAGSFGGVRIPLAILLGAFITHTVLLIRDVIADPTSHNIWPIEYLFWGVVLAVPSFLGWGLACMIGKSRAS
jgi:hypothetical protein